MKAREQERKEIEALHRWEEAHIFEGGGNIAILHNPARSCFQLWPIIGDEGDKIWKNNYWTIHFIGKIWKFLLHCFVHVNLCWPSPAKTCQKVQNRKKKEETFQSPICSPKLESG